MQKTINHNEGARETEKVGLKSVSVRYARTNLHTKKTGKTLTAYGLQECVNSVQP